MYKALDSRIRKWERSVLSENVCGRLQIRDT
jgi:hypothetical protein